MGDVFAIDRLNYFIQIMSISYTKYIILVIVFLNNHAVLALKFTVFSFADFQDLFCKIQIML